MTPAPSDDFEMTRAPSEVTGENVERSHVELATLTVTPSQHNDAKREHTQGEVILHTSKEAATALDIEATGKSSKSDEAVACIQAVVDLTELSDLAHATENEFVVGLHREANDRTFNPDDSEGSDDEVEEGNVITSGETQSLLASPPGSPKHHRHEKVTDDVPLDINAFAGAVRETLPDQHDDSVDVINIEDTTCIETTEKDVHVGHDAFLLELPQKNHDTEQHNFVLALPEIHTPHHAEIEEEEEHFPMLKQALSIIPTHLPTDIKDVQIEATAVPVDKETTEIHLDMVIKRQVPVIGYVILFCGFFALASVGTALDLQGFSVTPSMKTYWRLVATALAVLPMALVSLYRDGLPKLSLKQWFLFPVAALAYGHMTTAFVVALGMTSLANSFVFSNMTSLVIIFAKGLMGVPVLFLEGSGALIGVTGGVICSKDSSRTSDDSMEDNVHPHALLGDLIALSASFGTAAYLSIARDLRSRCDLFFFMFGIFFISSFFVLAFMLITGEPVEFSRHPDYGLFGWINMTPDRFPLEMYMVFIANIVGTLGYIAVLKYFDPVVVATIMLMEPVAAVFIGSWAGVDSLPGIQTWIGDAIVTIGSGLVIYSGSRTTQSIDATKAVRPPYETIDHGSKDKGQEQGEGQAHVKMLQTPVMMKRPSPKNRAE